MTDQNLTPEPVERLADLRAVVSRAQQNAALQAEVERLTKERDAAQDEHRFTLGLLDKAVAERDDALAMLADAERDMRQRAADACAGIEVDRWDKWRDGYDMLDQGASDGAGDCVNAILALPLKHADREEGK